jgi:thymidylate synthase
MDVDTIGQQELLSQEEFINKIKTDDEFAKKWGDLGPVYGKQWRNWTNDNFHKHVNSYDRKTNEPKIEHKVQHIDQIANLINDLKTNPDSRRLMVNAWNVGELDQMVLPPCHFSFQCYSHEENGKRYLSLAWNQRSVDVGLGLPFNIASYGLLLEIIAQEVGMIPYELIGNLGDCHIYNNHIDGIKEQLTRTPYNLPKLIINTEFWNHEYQTIDGWVSSMEVGDFTLENYQSHPSIKLPLSN